MIELHYLQMWTNCDGYFLTWHIVYSALTANVIVQVHCTSQQNLLIFTTVRFETQSFSPSWLYRLRCSLYKHSRWDWSRSKYDSWRRSVLTHWGRVTHICVANLTIIGSDNSLSPGRRHAITWTNIGILLIGPLVTYFSEMLIVFHTFSFKKIYLKMSSGKWWPFCYGLNVLTDLPKAP